MPRQPDRPWTFTGLPTPGPAYWLSARDDQVEAEHLEQMMELHRLEQAWIDDALAQVRKG